MTLKDKTHLPNCAYHNEIMRENAVDVNNLKYYTFGSSKKTLWKCKKCNSDYFSSFAGFLAGNRCPYCHGLKVNETNWAYSNYEMLSNSTNKEILKTFTPFSNKKNKWKCKKCNSEYISTISDFHSGCRCPYCRGVKVNETNWVYGVPCMYNASSDKEILKTVTKGSGRKNKWKCDRCNSEYISTFNDFNAGKRCPYCRGLKVNETNWAYNDKFLYAESLDKEVLKTATVSSTKKNIWKCQKCNILYTRSFNYVYSGRGCGKCRKKSSAEKQIEEILVANNINYKDEFRIAECKHKKCMSFDFAVFDSNSNLVFVIEYHGAQHYFSSQQFGSSQPEKVFRNIVFRDQLKNKFCKEHKIPKLTIPFTKFKNLEDIIINALLKYGLL